MNTCLWLIHVPRTGGTDTVHFCRDNLTHTKLVTNGHRGWEPPLMADLRATYAHVQVVVMLRDPVEHCRSYYAYSRDDPDHHLHSFSRGQAFGQWLRAIDPGYMADYFTRFFDRDHCDPSHAATVLAKATRVLDTTCLTEQFNALLAQLGESARLVTPQARDKGAFDAQDVALIKQLRSRDYDLLRLLRERSIADITLLH